MPFPHSSDSFFLPHFHLVSRSAPHTGPRNYVFLAPTHHTLSAPPQLSADQIGQLYELFQASKDVWLSPEELEAKLAAEGKTEEGIPAGQVLPNLDKANRIGGEGEGEGEKR